MSAADIAVLIASIACCAAVLGLLVAVASLRRETRALRSVADELGRQTVPLVADAHRAVDQAATELERVGAVLDSTESVHATVDSASKLAYRAFANPVVKVLAVRAGAATGLRRLASGSAPPAANGSGPPTHAAPAHAAPAHAASTHTAPAHGVPSRGATQPPARDRRRNVRTGDR